MISKSDFDAALVPGFRESVKSAYKELKHAGIADYGELLDDAGHFRQGVAQVRDCPLCGNSRLDSDELFLVYGMHICTCRQCGMTYSMEVLRRDIDQSIYTNADKAQNSFVAVKQQAAYKMLEKKKAQYILEKTKQYVLPPGNLLDIGSSTGVLLGAGVEAGWDAFGIEADKNIPDYSSIPAKRFQGFFPEVILGSEISFDLVTMLDVLEHIEKPRKFLHDTKPFLNKKGHLVIQVPNLNSLIVQLEGSSNANFGHGHWSYFTPTSLRKLLLSVGLKIVEMETIVSEVDRVMAYSTDEIENKVLALTQMKVKAEEITPERLHELELGYKILAVCHF